MNSNHEDIYTLSTRRPSREAHPSDPLDGRSAENRCASIPRIARLMALAIRFEGLVWNKTIQDYAELARLGGVTRARMTQIMGLLQLAPDLQEQLLFLPAIGKLNERNLRTIVSQLDWSEQRRIFRKIVPPSYRT